MKKRTHILALLGIFSVLNPLAAEETALSPQAEIAANQESNGPVDMQKVSEAFGHLIGKNLEALGFDFDIARLIQGIQDSISGKNSPMSETECVQAISVAQESAFQKQAEDNLAKANEFMSQNAAHNEIVILEKDRLHYRVDKQGSGDAVQAHFSPVIKYTGHFLDGSVFGASREEEMVSLDETISGFSRALIGMKEGEKRTIFIHPELGYGTSGYLPPNSLLTFEVELVKANAVHEDLESLSSNVPTHEQRAEEIAHPQIKEADKIR